jgi:hypothetical protein
MTSQANTQQKIPGRNATKVEGSTSPEPKEPPHKAMAKSKMQQQALMESI